MHSYYASIQYKPLWSFSLCWCSVISRFLPVKIKQFFISAITYYCRNLLNFELRNMVVGFEKIHSVAIKRFVCRQNYKIRVQRFNNTMFLEKKFCFYKQNKRTVFKFCYSKTKWVFDKWAKEKLTDELTVYMFCMRVRRLSHHCVSGY